MTTPRQRMRVLLVQHADAEDDEAGTHWSRLTPGQLTDWRLTVAAEALQQHNDARPLVSALLDLNLLPAAVRDDFQAWLDGKLPPDPTLSTKDWYTLCAVRAYRQTPTLVTEQGKRRESATQKAERVLASQPPEKPGMWRKGGVTAKLLLRVKNNDGREYLRIRNYLDAVGLYHGVKPPERTQNRPPNLTTRRPGRR